MLEPDAKSQVTLRYENGKPVEATAIVVSTQHKTRKIAPGRACATIVRPYIAKRLPRRADHQEDQVATSTRPAASRSAARTATPA